RVLVRKVRPHKRLAHDDDIGFLAHLSLGEQPAADEHHVQRAEVPVVAHADVGDVILAGWRRRLSLDRESGARAEPRQRQVTDRADRLNAWNVLDTRPRTLEEADAL